MRLLVIVSVVVFLAGCSNPNLEKVSVKVNVNSITHTMQGGMGASWHAISKDFPLQNEKYSTPVREMGPRGSAYGGNPPTSNTKAWEQLTGHASWLGFNFVRVELSQRMYEQEKNKFEWNSEEMLALYNILDWAQANNVDVFLQQMWMATEWNSIPGIHPIISAPKSLDDFANSITSLLKHLTIKKQYSCIKYFCMVNEPPGGTWGYWWNEGDTENTTAAGWKKLNEAFKQKNINIPISGPDWTNMPIFDETKLDFAPYLGAIDIHSYYGVDDKGEENLKQWANYSHAHNKPFLLTEYGNMNLGWGTNDPNQKSFDAAISNASDVIRGLRANVDAFNRWSFTNRGDLDGQWQLVQTFNRETKEYLSDVIPESEAYYGFGIISRFLSKYSSVIACENNQPDSVFMSAALLSPEKELSIIMVNKSNKSLLVSLDISSFSEKELNLYQVSKTIVNKPGFKLEALKAFKSDKSIKIELPARSISNATSFLLSDKDKGIFLK